MFFVAYPLHLDQLLVLLVFKNKIIQNYYFYLKKNSLEFVVIFIIIIIIIIIIIFIDLPHHPPFPEFLIVVN